MEIWKDIPGYEGLYQVSNHGRVKSFHGGGESMIRQRTNLRGYVYVFLHANGNRKNSRVHRLVGEAFLDNPENKPEINHKDGVKNNNHADNLEWVTRSENQKHAYKIGLQKNPYLGKFGKDHPTSRAVVQFDKRGHYMRVYGSISEAERETGVFNQGICNVCLGKQKTAGGYIWKYKQD